MDKHFQHLSSEERAVIMIERGNGVSLRAIGRALNRSVSTIAREVTRNRALHLALALKRPFVYDATAASGAENNWDTHYLPTVGTPTTTGTPTIGPTTGTPTILPDLEAGSAEHMTTGTPTICPSVDSASGTPPSMTLAVGFQQDWSA